MSEATDNPAPTGDATAAQAVVAQMSLKADTQVIVQLEVAVCYIANGEVLWQSGYDQDIDLARTGQTAFSR